MKRLTKTKAALLAVKDEIIEGFNKGNTLRFLADAYNTSTGSIRTLLMQEGVVMRRRGRPNKEK